jgi:hypothetical protein
MGCLPQVTDLLVVLPQVVLLQVASLLAVCQSW